jgi:hypothetical protein
MAHIRSESLDKSIKGAVFLASAMGSLECLLAEEPKKHTKRAVRIKKTLESLNLLLEMYDHSEDYDLVSLGIHLFDLLEKEANKALEEGYAKKSGKTPDKTYIVVRNYSGQTAAKTLWQVMSRKISSQSEAEDLMAHLASQDKSGKSFQVVKTTG